MDHETKAILLVMEDQLRLLTEQVLWATCTDGKVMFERSEQDKLRANLDKLARKLRTLEPVR